MTTHWDWIIVGSGFGGSVSALRLAEKGYSVLVLEKGSRFAPQDFPKTNWNLKKWFWAPALGFRGFFMMTFLRHLTSLNGVGVGGGSLVYANTLPTPGEAFFQAEDWGHLANWQEELEPHYETARRMLGATRNPDITTSDRALRKVAEGLGREHYHQPTEVGVFFGKPDEEVPDPFFSGEGPHRTGCNRCGGCMTGCRYGAKNTLDLNYLWLAERRGVSVRPETEVRRIRPSGEGFEVIAREGHRLVGKTHRTFTGSHVVLAAGVLGTVELLLRLKESREGLPKLSDRVGDRVRTNSEVLMGVTTRRRDLDLSEGIAITSILRTDERSHLEPVRFSSGSGFFRLLATPHAPGASAARRIGNMLRWTLLNPVKALRMYMVPDWAKYTAILMFMRTEEGFIRLKLGRKISRFFGRGLKSTAGKGVLPTAAIPEATELAGAFAQEIDGTPGSLLTETLFGIPTTAHILGGACMGNTPEDGVIDPEHRVFGYPGLMVVDGSAVSANPGVNPALTITALAERAMSFIPPKPVQPAPEKANV
jgi:cholesterol oxidase